MKRIVIPIYVDWTDGIAHLSGGEDYAKGENAKERSEYTLNQANKFFSACKRLIGAGYKPEIHVITGGSIEANQELNERIIASAYEFGMPDLFKSVTTNYGGDMMVNSNKEGREAINIVTNIVPNPIQNEFVKSAELRELVSKNIPREYEMKFKEYEYYQCVNLANENITEKDFNNLVALLKAEFASKDITIYAYYDPGYGLDIDFVPKNLTKGRAIDEIRKLFYVKDAPELDPRFAKSNPGFMRPTESDIALEIIMGDYAEVELVAIDHSMQNNVLFVATEDNTGISEVLEGTELKTFIQGKKLDALTQALNHVVDEIEKNGALPDYSKGNYRAVK